MPKEALFKIFMVAGMFSIAVIGVILRVGNII